MKRNQPFSPRRLLWKLICLTLGLLLCGMLLITAGFQYLLGQIRYTVPDIPQVPIQTTYTQKLESFLDPRDVNWQQLSADVSRQEQAVVNILLIGQDRREGETISRADSMILCSFHKGSKRLTMTSFLRDLYLPIPGHGSDRINAAYAYGGSSLLRKTLTENFDVRIDGTVEVDFSQFSTLIDTLGGVEITLRQDEAQLINQETGSTLEAGTQHLSGTQALAYSRIRSLDMDGDFSRTDRQRKVMSALVDAYRDAGLPALVGLMRQVLPMISTDMSESRILLLALEVFPMLSDLEISSQSVPAPEHCTDKMVNGMAVLVADMDAARKQLQMTTGSP